MSEWKKVKFLDLFSEPTKNGIYKSKEFHGRGAKIINMGEVFAYSFIGNQEMSRVEMNDKERKSFIVKNGDLLFARRSLVESGAGKCAIANGITEETTFESSIIRVRLNENNAIPLFYMYWMRSLSGRTAINGIVNGVNVKGIRATDLQNIEVDLPPLHTQHRIATILSRYDSLIENYQKQIKLLEEAAQRLYKEWFVDLHFPGHENTKIIDGVPEGWEKKKISDVCDTIGGGTPSTKVASYYEGGTISWVTPTDITKNNSLCLLSTEKKITNEGLNHSSAKMLPKEAILMTSRASVGYFGICDFEVCTNQGFISCVPFDKDFQMYLLYNLMNRVEEIRIKAGGSTYLEISKSVFRNFDIICPAPSIIKEFQGKAHCLLERTRIMVKQIRLLTEARDRLLPKLMNGEIELEGGKRPERPTIS